MRHKNVLCSPSLHRRMDGKISRRTPAFTKARRYYDGVIIIVLDVDGIGQW